MNFLYCGEYTQVADEIFGFSDLPYISAKM